MVWCGKAVPCEPWRGLVGAATSTNLQSAESLIPIHPTTTMRSTLSLLLLVTLAMLMCTSNMFVNAEDDKEDIDMDMEDTESTSAEDMFSEAGDEKKEEGKE